MEQHLEFKTNLLSIKIYVPKFGTVWTTWEFTYPPPRAVISASHYNLAVHCPIMMKFGTLVHYEPQGLVKSPRAIHNTSQLFQQILVTV